MKENIISMLEHKLSDDPLYQFLIANGVDKDKLFDPYIMNQLDTASYYSYSQVAKILNVEPHKIRNAVNRNDLKDYLGVQLLGEKRHPKLDYIGAFKLVMHNLILTEFESTPQRVAALAGVMTVGRPKEKKLLKRKEEYPVAEYNAKIDKLEASFLAFKDVIVNQSFDYEIKRLQEKSREINQQIQQIEEEKEKIKNAQEEFIKTLEIEEENIPETRIIFGLFKVQDKGSKVLKAVINAHKKSFHHTLEILDQKIEDNNLLLKDVENKIDKRAKELLASFDDEDESIKNNIKDQDKIIKLENTDESIKNNIIDIKSRS